MASDFYKRTKELFEDFQKRELQYLNAERATAGRFQVINENSMPSQEYMEKLNKTEKETEEAYLGLMHHIERLDHRTESIRDKLQKLESLRLSMNSKAPVLPYSKNTHDRSLQDYTSSSNLLTDSLLRDTILHPNQFLLSEKKLADSPSQTDLMFCENCQFPIAISTTKSRYSLSPDNSLNEAMPPFQNRSLSSQVVKNDSQTVVQLHDKNEIPLNLNKEDSLKIPSPPTQSLSKISEETTVQNQNLLDKFQTISTDTSLPMQIQTKPFENEISPSPTVMSATCDKQFTTELSTDADNKEHDTDKSVNARVNVLNSNEENRVVTLNSSVVSEVINHPEVNKDTGLTTDIVVDDVSALSVYQDVSLLESEGEISISKLNGRKSTLNLDGQNDKLSESSISIGGAPSPSLHSDNVSVVSDSDSYDEKGRLKESAAYQALLGNVSVTKKTQKTPAYSESDSEDEVERALANATRKSSSVPITKTVHEEKPDHHPKKDITEPITKNEPRKSISLSKSQHLTKNTRKVLGLDTSSGSEGEIRIAAKTSGKIEEDSDEFDFYD